MISRTLSQLGPSLPRPAHVMQVVLSPASIATMSNSPPPPQSPTPGMQPVTPPRCGLLYATYLSGRPTCLTPKLSGRACEKSSRVPESNQ